jgi:hypothetical protein
MPADLARWSRVVVAVLGGVALGFGLGRLVLGGERIAGTVWTVLGVILLWWALLWRRKQIPGAPESEADGTHTIE